MNEGTRLPVPDRGVAEVDGTHVEYVHTTWQDPLTSVEEYRTSEGVFRAEMNRDTGAIDIFRDGQLVEETSVQDLAAQLTATLQAENSQIREARRVRTQGNTILPGSSCSVTMGAISVANGLLWGVAGLAVPPAAPVALAAGTVTSAVITAAGTQC